jgi:hypothetical protein
MKKIFLLIFITQSMLQTSVLANKILHQSIEIPFENRANLYPQSHDENFEQVSLQHVDEKDINRSGEILQKNELKYGSNAINMINVLLIAEILGAISVFLLLAFEYSRSYMPYVPSHEISSINLS